MPRTLMGCSRLRQIWHGARIFDEFLQGRHDFGPDKQFAENIDLLLQLRVRNGFHELLGRRARHRIIFGHLCGRGPGDAKSFSFAGELCHETYGMRATRIEGAARKQQIPHNSVAQVAFQARDASKSGNKPQAQLGKSKARHFVGYDDVASESELESPAKASPVNRRNGDKGSRVYRVHNRVNALKKAANSFWAFSLGNRSCMTIEFAQVSACGKNRFSGARDNARGSFGAERAEGAGEYF